MFTSEKWEVSNSGGRVIKAGLGHPDVICVLETVPLKISPEVHERAHLIAAAPELLAVAKRYVEQGEAVYAEMGKGKPTNTQYTLSVEAIAKAEGEL